MVPRLLRLYFRGIDGRIGIADRCSAGHENTGRVRKISVRCDKIQLTKMEWFCKLIITICMSVYGWIWSSKVRLRPNAGTKERGKSYEQTSDKP